MRIRSVPGFLVALVVLVAGGSSSAPSGPSASKPPTAGEATSSIRNLQVGPADSLAFARKMRGKMNLVAVRPKTVQLKSVEFGIDGKSIGTSSELPYKVEFDSATASDGQHVIKAVGKDETGKEVWSASIKVEIVNSAKPRTAKPDAGPRVRSSIPSRRPSANARPGSAPRTGKTASRKNAPDDAAHPLPAGLRLNQTYSNEHYGFSIKYPETWTFQDETVTMKPKSQSDFRLVFGSYPIEKASLIVNVRRVKLEAGTDAARFATYNPYVKEWKKRTVLGSPAFATTSRVLAPKPALVHRLIIIKDGHAWMLNCTDYAGKSPNEGLGLLEHMVATITSPTQPQ